MGYLSEAQLDANPYKQLRYETDYSKKTWDIYSSNFNIRRSVRYFNEVEIS